MQQHTKRFPPAMGPVQEDGLLSPDGVYYPCGYLCHDEAAEEIAGVFCAFDLERRGWVHISNSCLYSEKDLTQPQIDLLFDVYRLDPGSSLGTAIARHLWGQP